MFLSFERQDALILTRCLAVRYLQLHLEQNCCGRAVHDGNAHPATAFQLGQRHQLGPLFVIVSDAEAETSIVGPLPPLLIASLVVKQA